MVAYSCNLSCKGCISLSDFPRNGIEKFEDLEKSITYWSRHIVPHVVSIFGGEPLLHPKLLQILKLVRENWPHSNIRLITNGYLFDIIGVEYNKIKLFNIFKKYNDVKDNMQ